MFEIITSKSSVQLCGNLSTPELFGASPPHFYLLCCSPIAVIFTVLSQFLIYHVNGYPPNASDVTFYLCRLLLLVPTLSEVPFLFHLNSSVAISSFQIVWVAFFLNSVRELHSQVDFERTFLHCQARFICRYTMRDQ